MIANENFYQCVCFLLTTFYVQKGIKVSNLKSISRFIDVDKGCHEKGELAFEFLFFKLIFVFIFKKIILTCASLDKQHPLLPLCINI